MVKDNNVFRLLGFEAKLRANGVELEYMKDDIRECLIDISGQYSLLKEYSKDIYNYCLDNPDFDKEATHLIKAANTIKNCKKPDLLFKTDSPNYYQLSLLVGADVEYAVQLLMSESNRDEYRFFFLDFFIMSNDQNSNKGCCCETYAIKDFGIYKFELELIFFFLMKYNESFKKHDYYLDL